MKRIVSVIALLAIAATALPQPASTTIAAVLAAPDRFNHKMVKVIGVVTDLKLKTSKKGNPYATFWLHSGARRIQVYLQAHPVGITDKDTVTVVGEFAVERKVGSSVFSNEIDASERVKGSVKKAVAPPKPASKKPKSGRK